MSTNQCIVQFHQTHVCEIYFPDTCLLIRLIVLRLYIIESDFRFQFTISVPGGGRLSTRLTVTTAALIWILAIICAIPAGIGSYIRPIVSPHTHKVLHILNNTANSTIIDHYIILLLINCA